MRKLNNKRNPKVLDKTNLPQNKLVYYFRRGPKFGSWNKAFVRQADDRIVYLSPSSQHFGPPVAAAYEDIELVPDSPLLRELDEIGYLFPCSSTVLPEIDRPVQSDCTSSTEGAVSKDVITREPSPENTDELINLDENLARLTPDPIGNESEVHTWISHLSSRAYLCNHVARRVINQPLQVISTSMSGSAWSKNSPCSKYYTHLLAQTHEPSIPEKSVGSSKFIKPPSNPFPFHSAEQQVLREMYKVIGDKLATEFCMQFAPR